MSGSSYPCSIFAQYRMIRDIYVLLEDGDRRVLNRFNLTPSQYEVLSLLDIEESQRLTMLSERLLCARSTITRIIDQLEQAGLVRRITDADDRRAQRVMLTPAGAALLQRARSSHRDSLVSRISVLSEGENRQLDQLLNKLHRGLRAQLDANGEVGELDC